MWKRMARIHLDCATLLARRCVKTGAWPAVPKINEDLTNLLLQEEANRASSARNGIDAATLQRLTDAWHDFLPCRARPSSKGRQGPPRLQVHDGASCCSMHRSGSDCPPRQPTP